MFSPIGDFRITYTDISECEYPQDTGLRVNDVGRLFQIEYGNNTLIHGLVLDWAGCVRFGVYDDDGWYVKEYVDV